MTLNDYKIKAIEMFLDFDGKYDMSDRGITDIRIYYLNEKLKRVLEADSKESIVGMFHPTLRVFFEEMKK